MIELTSNGYITLGSGAAFAAAEARKAVLAALPRAEADALSQKELFKGAQVGRGTGQRALKELQKEGKVLRKGTGRRKNAYRYWAPEIHSAQVPNTKAQKESGEVISEVL